MTTRWTQKTLAVCVVTAIMLIASTAWGEWGEGVEGGPFRLHPGLSMSVGFDSNVYYTSRQESGRLHQSPEMFVEPKLVLQTADPGAWDLEGEASVGWRQYFSDDDRVRGQSGLSAAIDGQALWNGEGTASIRLSESFVRSNETPSTAGGDPINRIFNRAGIMFGLHPGGRILETHASYDFSFYRHNRLVDLDRHTHHLGWNANWSFLPKTALTAEVDYRLIRYDQEFRGSETVSPEGRFRNANSNPLRVMGGVQGLITPRISLGLRGGYGWAFYDDEPENDHSGLLAKAEASYQFGNIEFDNRLRVGYEYGFTDSSIGNFFTSHRALAGYEQGFVDNRLRLNLEVSTQIRDYASTGVESAETEAAEIFFTEDGLSDFLVSVNAGTTFEIRNGWNVGLRYGFRSNLTEDVITVEGIGEDSVRDYQRHHVLLTTELRY